MSAYMVRWWRWCLWCVDRFGCAFHRSAVFIICVDWGLVGPKVIRAWWQGRARVWVARRGGLRRILEVGVLIIRTDLDQLLGWNTRQISGQIWISSWAEIQHGRYQDRSGSAPGLKYNMADIRTDLDQLLGWNTTWQISGQIWISSWAGIQHGRYQDRSGSAPGLDYNMADIRTDLNQLMSLRGNYVLQRCYGNHAKLG